MTALLVTGCSTSGGPRKLSYEATLRRVELALKEEKIFEAKRWAEKAVTARPNHPAAQTLMAKVLDREIAREKSLLDEKLPEEFTSQEKKLEIKTWLERSRGFLEAREYDEALLAAEKVFQLDANHAEASRLMDEIKQRARADGKDESVFLQEIYEQEIQTRIQQYQKQARNWMENNRLGAARLTLEKILILDPENREAQKLLAALDRKEDPLLREFPSDFLESE